MSEKNLVYPVPATRWQTQYFIFKLKTCYQVAQENPKRVGRGGQRGRKEGAPELWNERFYLI